MWVNIARQDFLNASRNKRKWTKIISTINKAPSIIFTPLTEDDNYSHQKGDYSDSFTLQLGCLSFGGSTAATTSFF